MSFKEFLQEEKGDKAAYQAFFNKMLKKFGVESADDLDADKKKEFYDAIDAGWEGDNEEKELDEAYAKSSGYKRTEDAINLLVKSLDPKSNLAKSISASTDNVVPEFTKMSKLMEKILDLWDDVERTAGM
jgi:uncharacterized protein YfbU (UPF0304 family)